MATGFSAGKTHGHWIPWETSSPNPTPGDVYVWRSSVDLTAGELGGFDVSAEERQRATKFLRVEDRNRYLTGRLLLRRILACHIGCAPSDLIFIQDRYGRPSLANPPTEGLDFNITHSGRWVLLALAEGRRVGIDTEKIRSDIDFHSIMRRVFSPPERAAVNTLSEGEQEGAFFWHWTRKEALAKAIGVGLGAPFTEIDVRDGTYQTWEVRSLVVDRSYHSAIAAFGSDWRLTCWDA